MRLVEIIKSFGKFRRKRSTEKEVDKLAEYPKGGCENPALDVTITDGSSSSSAESSRSGSLDFSAVQLEQSTEDHLDHLEEEEEDTDDRSSVSSSSVEDGTASTTTNPQISSSHSSPSSSSFVVRSHLLVSAWRRLKRVRAVGILCALASVLFWSFNGLLIKLNDGYFGVHVLESLTISSFIVCLVYLTFIFSVYGRRRPANNGGGGGGLSSTSSVTSFASSTLSTSSSKKDIFVGGGVSKGGLHHHHLPSTLDWRVILGVPGERWSLFLRCFLGTISLATFYTSYTYIPLSDATTIRFTSPVFIAAFAHFLVAEPFGLLQVVNSCTTLAGVVLIGRPSFLFGGPSSSGGDNSTSFDSNSTTTTTSPTFFHFYAQFGGGSSEEGGGGVQGGSSSNFNGRTHTAIGLALALISAVSISVSMIAMRRMKRTPAALVIFWFSACNVVLGLLGLAVLGRWSVPPGVTSWAIIGSTTLCNGFDQLFVTLALKLENAGAVAVIQALCVVLSFLFSIAILQETLYWTSALGGAFIFLSVLMLGFAKMASEMAKSSDDKKKVPPKSDCNKGGGGGRWRRRIFQLNLSTAAAKLKQSKSFDIISSSSSSHQQQKVGHLSSLGAFSNPTLSSTDSLSPNFTFAIAPPVYPLYQNTITSTSPSSATTESGLYGVGSEPYLLRVAPINGCEAQHRGLRPEQHNNNSIDGNNNVG